MVIVKMNSTEQQQRRQPDDAHHVKEYLRMERQFLAFFVILQFLFSVLFPAFSVLHWNVRYACVLSLILAMLDCTLSGLSCVNGTFSFCCDYSAWVQRDYTLLELVLVLLFLLLLLQPPSSFLFFLFFLRIESHYRCINVWRLFYAFDIFSSCRPPPPLNHGMSVSQYVLRCERQKFNSLFVFVFTAFFLQKSVKNEICASFVSLNRTQWMRELVTFLFFVEKTTRTTHSYM